MREERQARQAPPQDVEGGPDPVGIALSSLVAGAAAGAAVIALGTFLFRLGPPPSEEADVPQLLLPVAVLAALVLAAGLAWGRARAITDGWRRALTAALGAFGGLLLGALTVPADMLAGGGGLILYAALMGAVAVRAARAARRAELT